MTSSTHGPSDVLSRLSNFLPTGTFLTFQAIVPIFTNNGECGNSERIMTGALLVTFAVICWVLNFTDSVKTDSGELFYGLVTTQGLYNPQFKGNKIAGNVITGAVYMDGNQKYKLNPFDFVNGICEVVVLGALTLLTPPVSTCYYPHIPSTLTKTVPILVAIIVAMYFTFAPPPRHGVGFSVATGNMFPDESTHGDLKGPQEIQSPVAEKDKKSSRSIPVPSEGTGGTNAGGDRIV